MTTPTINVEDLGTYTRLTFGTDTKLDIEADFTINGGAVVASSTELTSAASSARAACDHATLVNINLATNGLTPVDGDPITEGQRVLVAAQTDPTENGIYIASSGAWVRADDELKYGTSAPIVSGATHSAHSFVLTDGPAGGSVPDGNPITMTLSAGGGGGGGAPIDDGASQPAAVWSSSKLDSEISNGSNILSGTIAVARLPTTGFKASSLTTGTMAYANLPTTPLSTPDPAKLWNAADSKTYANSLNNGFIYKVECIYATTANINLATNGLAAVDGSALIAGQRILVKDQTVQTENGIYVADPGAWSRSSDFSGGFIVYGAATFVTSGTTHMGQTFYTSGGTSGGVIGGNIVWSQASDPTGTIDAHTHNAADIVSGTLDAARLASIPAASLTLGTLAAARLPTTGFPAVSLDVGTIPAASLPFTANASSVTASDLWDAPTNKEYVDNYASGNLLLTSCAYATNSPINLATNGLAAVDGTALVAGERILVKDQALQTENGIYIASAGAWTRATDLDGAAEIVYGATTKIDGGGVNAGKSYVIIGGTTGTQVGANPIIWAQIAGTVSHVHDAADFTSGVLDVARLPMDPAVFPAVTPNTLWDSLNTKNYVDSINPPLTYYYAARVASDVNIPSLSGLLVVDTITLAEGDRVLLFAQTSSIDNGIYIASAGAWSRALDFAAGTTTSGGGSITILEGANYDYSTFAVSGTPGVSILIGTDAVNFVRIGGADTTNSFTFGFMENSSAFPIDGQSSASAGSGGSYIDITGSFPSVKLRIMLSGWYKFTQYAKVQLLSSAVDRVGVGASFIDSYTGLDVISSNGGNNIGIHLLNGSNVNEAGSTKEFTTEVIAYIDTTISGPRSYTATFGNYNAFVSNNFTRLYIEYLN